MKKFNKISWKTIWKNKGLGRNNKDIYTLQDLIALDGFDSKMGFINENNWCNYTSHVNIRLKLISGNKILEVGCGSGAFLLPFSNNGMSVYGIDYSEELIYIARSVIPAGKFIISEANSIPFEDLYFDSVISNAVFFYFPDYDYANQSLLEILRVLKSGGTAAILDVSDLNSKYIAEELRAKEIGEENYKKLYIEPGLSHLYFDRTWFENFGFLNGVDVFIEDQCIDGYLNSSYRFNVYLTKRI
jgi:SAM-dependent methyltransferase